MEKTEKKRPLFNNDLRNKLVDRIDVQGSEEIVEKVEDILCSHIVLTAREIGERLTVAIFKKLIG